MSQAISTHPDAEGDPDKGNPSIDKSPPVKKNAKKKLRILIPLGILLIAAGIGVRYWLTRPDDDAIALSGRIESYESDLGTKVGGRVESVAVREGDLVTKGQVVAKLDDQELNAQLLAAKAEVSAAAESVTQAKLQIDVVDAQTQEAQLTLQQSEGDSAGRVSQANANVATAEAQLKSAQAQVQQAQSALDLARNDRDRFSTLARHGYFGNHALPRGSRELQRHGLYGRGRNCGTGLS